MTEKLELKVYKMNECDYVLSSLSREETNEWYKAEFCCDDKDQPLEEVEECKNEDGYWYEATIGEIIDEIMETTKEVRAKQMACTYFLWESFGEAIQRISYEGTYKCPFVLSSTEY